MNSERDLTRVVRSWMREDEHESADRVLDTVLDALDATPQRRAIGWPVRRLFEMNNTMKFTVAAAVIAVAAIGLAYVMAPNVGTPPQPSPSPTMSADATPVSMPVYGSLDPGWYSVVNPGYTPVEASFLVPEGWEAEDNGAMSKNPDSSAELSMAFYVVTHVYEDACQSEGTLSPIGPTSEDLVAALLSQRNVVADGPSDTIIDDYPAQRVDLRYPPELDLSTCRYPDELIQVWANEAETDFFALSVNRSGSVYTADVDGQRVVVTAVHGPDATAADIAELDEIIGSLTFATDP